MMITTTALAQSFTQTQEIRGQFRDGVIDLGRGQLIVAVYERDSLWRVDPATGDVATRIKVGKGPVALASDGTFIACANYLDDSVSLIRLSDLSVVSTVAVGDSPSAIAALGDGRFIVVNTFSDSLSVIDTRGTVSVSSMEGAPAVPVAIAVTRDQVAVASRADRKIYCYDRASLSPSKQIALSGATTDLAALAGDVVIALGPSGLQRIDLSTGNVGKNISLKARSIDADGGLLHVATDDSYLTYDENLVPVATHPLAEGASVIVVRDGVVALLDPKSQIMQTHNLAALQPAAATAPAPAAEPAPDNRGDMVIVEAKPVVETAAPMPDSTPTEATPEAVAPTPAVEEATAAPEMVATTTAGPTGNDSASVRRNPFLSSGVRAPSPGRPSVSPLEQLSQKTITDAVIRPTEFGSSSGGFQAPDLTKPLENIKFSSAKRASSEAPTSYKDFRAELGDMKLQSDNFTHKQEPVEIEAEGNVLITQQSSTISADLIHYILDPVPAADVKKNETILEGEMTEKGAPLDQGRLILDNAHIVEPTREMTAEHVEYDFRTGAGELTKAKGQAGIYYFSAEKLHLHGPQTLSGDDVWVTTCDRPNPHYRIRLSDVELVDGEPTGGSNARLQLGKANTPLYLPRWHRGGVGGSPWNIDFDSGRQAKTGYYVNLGQQYEINPDVSLGPRIFATEKEGVGLGADLYYDFMENPASHLYRTKGEAHGLFTTKERGYVHWYHRYEYSNDLVVRAQVEHWSDQDFYKDFYYDTFRNRSRPRSFVNLTYRQPNYIATGTVRTQTHGWFSETEQAPEFTFHQLERKIANDLYFTFDTVNGYYNREPYGIDAARSVNVARLTYNWDPLPALAITPFLQLDTSFYTRDRRDNNPYARFGSTAGVTAQSRFSRTYNGRWGFSAFKHIVVPSVTYSYRPRTNVKAPEIPQFDPLDSDFGRSRIELKLSNVFYGRDAESGEVWQVGRITLYQGNDFWNETRRTEDYEVEIDIRPRPWWGFQLVGERQETSNEDSSLAQFSLARNYPRFYEEVIGNIFGSPNAQDFSGRFGDYNRVLSQVYYDGEPRGGKFSGRVGFAYTETQSQVFNREALYGLGYKISDKWGFGFEHIYDLEDNNLRRQTYELRRSLHCWETAIRFRDRESGFDLNVEFNIKAFPGSRVKF